MMSGENNTKWHKRYLELAKQIGSWSKDTTKIGSVVIGSKGQVLSQGYNGFPRNIRDDHERLINRITKYTYTIHAEMNSLHNASFNGTSLVGSTLYVYGLPICSECAKGVIQVGIQEVVMPVLNTQDPKWLESWKFSESLLTEAGVKITFIDME